MRKLIKIISNIIFTILLVLLAISFYSWFQIEVQHKQYSSLFGYSMFEVVTGSMSGTIEVNDYIIVKKENNYNLKDVITFRDGNSLVTHRIVEIQPNSIVTRGDVNNSNDIKISYDDVIGKVVYIIPNGAIWKRVFMDWKILLLMLITVLFFTFYFSVDNKPKEKKEKNKKVKEIKEEIKKVEQIEEVKEEIIIDEETHITPMEEVLKAIELNTKKKVTTPPKKRGRPKKLTEEVVEVKKRGRPKKNSK